MGKRFLIDTNVLIEFQINLLPQKSQDFVSAVIDEEFNVSIINKIEILGSKFVTADTENFMQLVTVFELDINIVNATIELRKRHKIKLPDAIIAATAVVHGLTLITRNVKDFANIDNLDIINPYQL
jgi:predicted nucleic acid-binding protein